MILTDLLRTDPTVADDVLDLAKTAAVLPPDSRALLLRHADELLNAARVPTP